MLRTVYTGRGTMKKIFHAAVVAVCASVIFTSCNKDYTCTCTVKSAGVTHVISNDVGTTTKSDDRRVTRAKSLIRLTSRSYGGK